MSTTYRDFKYLREHGYVGNRVTLGRWIEQGIFPAPVRIAANTVRWTDDQLRQYDEAVKARGVSKTPAR